MAEAALEGRPDGAEESPEEGVAQQAATDDFLDGITQTEGPLAMYKENRLSGRYRRVRSSSDYDCEHTHYTAIQLACCTKVREPQQHS